MKAFTKEVHREPTTRNSYPNGALRSESLHKDNPLKWEEALTMLAEDKEAHREPNNLANYWQSSRGGGLNITTL